MAVLKQRETVANMQLKGFSEKPGGRHRAFNYVTLDGKKSVITTHISRTPQHKVLPDTLISSMAQQCKLSRNQFIEFAQCRMSQVEYELILKNNGDL